jgi:hypothetical protein
MVVAETHITHSVLPLLSETMSSLVYGYGDVLDASVCSVFIVCTLFYHLVNSNTYYCHSHDLFQDISHIFMVFQQPCLQGCVLLKKIIIVCSFSLGLVWDMGFISILLRMMKNMAVKSLVITVITMLEKKQKARM